MTARPGPRLLAVATVLLAATSTLTGTIGTGPAAAAAPAPACPTPQAPVLVGEVPGVLFEGAVVDRRGRLYVTDLQGGRVLRFDSPGATPTVVTTLPEANGAGALALDNDGTVLVGGGA